MKKRILITVLILALVVLVWSIYGYFNSTHSLTVNYSGAQDLVITNEKSDKISIQKSGQSVRIWNSQVYKIQYTGDTGFASGSENISANQTDVSIDPDYSTVNYASLIDKIQPIINKILVSKYPNLGSLYTIDKGHMISRGKWFYATLEYKKGYDFNSDTLRVLFEFSSGKWSLVTTPDILFTSHNYPNIPVSILDWANG